MQTEKHLKRESSNKYIELSERILEGVISGIITAIILKMISW